LEAYRSALEELQLKKRALKKPKEIALAKSMLEEQFSLNVPLQQQLEDNDEMEMEVEEMGERPTSVARSHETGSSDAMTTTEQQLQQLDDPESLMTPFTAEDADKWFTDCLLDIPASTCPLLCSNSNSNSTTPVINNPLQDDDDNWFPSMSTADSLQLQQFLA
jgi:hypothetical protein